jgi:hypothetical protein
VTRLIFRFAGVALVPTLGLAAAALLAPGRAELAGHVYLLVLCGIVLTAFVAATRRAHPAGGPSLFELALRRRQPRHDRLAELARLEREVALASANAFDLHYRLRPVVREIAGGLLAARRGIELDARPEAARLALGEEAWELARADREPPVDRAGPGWGPARLRAVVEALEAL